MNNVPPVPIELRTGSSRILGLAGDGIEELKVRYV
jgi:hypothetical protein